MSRKSEKYVVKKTVHLTRANDELIRADAQFRGVSVDDIINAAIDGAYCPGTPLAIIEASYLLDQYMRETLDANEVKVSVSRIVGWLGDHPISDNSVLVDVFAHYDFENGMLSSKIDGNDYVHNQMDCAQRLLAERVKGYTVSDHTCESLVNDALQNWDVLWREKAVYDALASIAYMVEPRSAFSWFEGILLIYRMDSLAWQQWGSD